MWGLRRVLLAGLMLWQLSTALRQWGLGPAAAVSKWALRSQAGNNVDILPAAFTLRGMAAEGETGVLSPAHLDVNSFGFLYNKSAMGISQQVRIEWAGEAKGEGEERRKGPKRVLLLAKPDQEVIESVDKALAFLLSRGLHVLVEDSLQRHVSAVHTNSGAFEVFHPDNGRSGVDLIITFGGDGLLMHCNSLFQGADASVPPIISFDFGSLGFLAPFMYENFEAEIDRIIEHGAVLTLRMRLECTIWRAGLKGKPAFTHHVLNEAVIDRGTAPFLSVIDVHCNKQYLTTIQGDGVIISTPTGSTAYSLAAGGSMVHPSVPAILITPICAHTLSIRPLLLPDSSELQCDMPLDARSNGWVSFDGKYRQELQRGDSVKITLSSSPLPTVSRENFTVDWFHALRTGFNFNHRARQAGPLNSNVQQAGNV